MGESKNNYYDNLVSNLKNNKFIAFAILTVVVLSSLISFIKLFTSNDITPILNSDNSTNVVTNVYNSVVEKEENKAVVSKNKNNAITYRELSFQLKDEHKGVREIKVDNKPITLLMTSTRLNPRIKIRSNNNVDQEVSIITISGDTCKTQILNQNNRQPIRIIPNCN